MAWGLFAGMLGFDKSARMLAGKRTLEVESMKAAAVAKDKVDHTKRSRLPFVDSLFGCNNSWPIALAGAHLVAQVLVITNEGPQG
jgi:acetone carboxylase gamma subunit